jgi:hypothetical protein
LYPTIKNMCNNEKVKVLFCSEGRRDGLLRMIRVLWSQRLQCSCQI